MLSQSVEYALRAMVHLATLEPGVCETSQAIASRTKVSPGYLSKILRDLVVAELIESRRGPNGGFLLARPAPDISMLQVVNAVDPFHRITKCPLGNAAHISLCPLHRRIDDARTRIEHQFHETSLAEIIGDAKAPEKCCGALNPPTIRGAVR